MAKRVERGEWPGPDVLLLDGGILTLYPQGHGLGPVIGKISRDGGNSWGNRLTGLPDRMTDGLEHFRTDVNL